jgi:hypothetical protein
MCCKMEATKARGGAMYVECNSIECLLSYMNEGIPRSLYAPRRSRIRTRRAEHWQHAAATCHCRQDIAMSSSLTCSRNTEVWHSLYKLMLSLVGAELGLRA